MDPQNRKKNFQGGWHTPYMSSRKDPANMLRRQQSLTQAKLEEQRFLTERVHRGRKSGAALKRRIAGANPKVLGLPAKIAAF